MAGSASPVTSSSYQLPVTESSPVTDSSSSTTNRTGVQTTSSLQSMQGKSSSDCCLVWCWNKICGFFSAIGRLICSLFGGNSQKPSTSSSQGTGSSQTSTSALEPVQSSQTAVSTQSNSTSVQIIQTTSTPEPVQPFQTASQSQANSTSTQKANLTTTNTLTPTSSTLPKTEITGTEWANDLLKEYETDSPTNEWLKSRTHKNITDDTRAPEAKYVRFLSTNFGYELGNDFLFYSTLKQLQLVYELTNTEHGPSRCSVDYSTLDHLCKSIQPDAYTTQAMLNELQSPLEVSRLKQTSPVPEVHLVVRDLLLKRSKAVVTT